MPIATAKSPPLGRARLTELYTAAQTCVPADRGQGLIRKWTGGCRPDAAVSDYRLAAMMADAVLLAADLMVSLPSPSGSTAFDRLARRRGAMSPADKVAVAALNAARFRLLSVDRGGSDHRLHARDAITGEQLRLDAEDVPPLDDGLAIFGRVIATDGKDGYLIGAVTPLDPAAVTVAVTHQAAGARGAAQNARWAEAVYGHVVRHGTLDIPGLNRPAADPDADDLFEDVDSELLALARAWAELDNAAPDVELLHATRQSATLQGVLDALAGAIRAGDAADAAMQAAFERVLAVQLKTVAARERGGSGGLSLRAIVATIDEAIARRGWPARARALFDRARPAGPGTANAGDASLDKLVQRIQALRAKTVAQGCTEAEAIAAAEKVAELLDRHDLSLSELEMKAQPCEGIGVQTSRRRMAPIDGCIPTVAAFCDCRVWVERLEGKGLRYIYFGLRGDVAAAQYLHEMVERAFDTETQRFRKTELYGAMAGDRRRASHSFQIGLADGISEKLNRLRRARDDAMQSASGRDLVPVKAALVDAEIDKLGLNLSRRAVGARKRVDADAFAAGQAAGERFELAPALGA